MSTVLYVYACVGIATSILMTFAMRRHYKSIEREWIWADTFNALFLLFLWPVFCYLLIRNAINDRKES